ncbi:hypothetical protein HN840_01230 [archaeon]|jgi:hypothetical protein|nr:hypothetical protein [archaeon]MBT3731040.1 hypothetical protein [archaeon]MBT4669722.1 hypothetical protein [archaeon]MBT5029872.1 hypothetical protein [archaeon]MBT5288444.1 hypothetical protein [archaeon]
MRDKIKLVPLVLGLSSGCLGHQNLEVSPNYGTEYTQEHLQSDIERELGKHDPVSLSVLERDYTSDEKSDLTRLQFITNNEGNSFIAAYNPITNELILPHYSDNFESNEEVLGALDHELWHSIYNQIFERKNLSGYDGPSLEDAELYCYDSVRTDRFQGVRDEVEFNTQFRVAMVNYETNLKKYSKLKDKLDHLRPLLGRLNFEDYSSYVEDDYIEKVQEDCENFEREYFPDEFDDIIENSMLMRKIEAEFEAIQAKKGISQTLEGQEREEFLEDLLEDFESFNNYFEGEDFVEEYLAAKKIEDDLLEFANQYQMGRFEVGISSLDLEISQLEEGSSERSELELKKLRLETRYTHFKFEKNIYADLEFEGGIDDIMGFFQSTITQGKSNDTIYDCNEFLAREFNEMYSLDFDEMNEQGWPLTRESLDFWSQFTVEGEPMFRKGIERYTIALDLIEKGKDPEKVKERLEFAENYRHQGNSFDWASEDFQIQGEVESLEDKREMLDSMIEDLME